ncbi:VanZ family protein [Devosia sp. PTR5]|uniref:VanZ family protein n=1 Tax=Devosia oryzisoli TaxID=2774138 RepID=A0A927IS95_9HYPH|nr:VanZ family protein [Devosia oryzisoli]MBD8065224.1 VanZ family protein [Devosia oryzisoli]
MTERTLRILAWLTILALAFATLSPIGLRPRSPMPVDLERSAAYLVVGFLFALGYPRQIWAAVVIVLVAVFGLEGLQHIRPDRHGEWHDAVVKAAGAMVGLGVGWLVAQALVRLVPRRQP